MNEVYTEKEILGDALNSEKNATTLYNLGANECVHDNLRETMLDLLAKEHDIQVDVFNQMHTMGYYPTPLLRSKKSAGSKNKI
ncbi:MAG: spore coat protein [Eubacterium ventriosum]